MGVHALSTRFQPRGPSWPGPRTSPEGRASPDEGSDRRVLFVPERPVLSFLEGFVTGDQEASLRDQLTVQILTQIRDNLDLIRKKQDSFSVEQHELSIRLTKLEERNERITRLESAFERVDGRVDVLMKDKDRRDGAVGLASWLSRHWPFAGLAALIAALVAWANGKVG
jgi:hypothetical protein